ncbi:biopolymer transporter ExbD, partial [Pinirhizobacter sp.]|uniref:biopolymer transporter ExbD n=1 Tax=Pinirhizobacter sp. TaxID=2950432 RepID=UPI002F3FFEB4
MSMSTGGNSGGPMSEINVTPLVDVMLVLLIIFMITAPLMTHRIKIDLPKANPNVKEEVNVEP